MVKLLILADDFTGALDTGVQFAEEGAATLVVTDPNYDFSPPPGGENVIVFDTETRHVSPEAAYRTISHAVSLAKGAGISYFYKKTDSALRGNIGAELAALMDAAGAPRLHFVPAYPRMGRTTRQGIHYIDGIPVAESVFGRDPFNPVTCSNVTELIGMQSARKVFSIDKEPLSHDRNGILVYDASTDADLKSIANGLARSRELNFLAGCAGFAAALPALLGLKGTAPTRKELLSRLLVICGSVNPITLAQLDEAEKSGALRLRIRPEQKLEPLWSFSREAESTLKSWADLCRQNEICILDTNDLPGSDETAQYAAAHGLSLEETRAIIPKSVGGMVKRLLEFGLNSTFLVTGGDTLLGVMRQIGIDRLSPAGELEAGVVLSHFSFQGKSYPILSKSGGFGSKALMMELMEKIRTPSAEKQP